MGNVLIGIDLGTTYLKAAAFDARTGRALASDGVRLRVITGEAGQREQSPMEMARALERVMGRLRQALGRGWQAVTGLGLAAQGGSTCIVDRRTAKAFTPMILWNDTRGYRYFPRVTRGTTAAYWRRRTMRNEPGMGLARMLWLRETRPGLFRDTNLYTGAGEFFYFLLTGVWRQDAGNALQTGCYHAGRKALDPEILAIADVGTDFVAPMRDGHELHPLSADAARRFGLPAGIPVAGPYMDHEAGYLSAVGTGDRPLQCSLGTAWVGNVMLPETARWTSPVQLVLPGITGPGWLVVQPLMTGNIILDWALEQFVDADHGRALKALPALFQEDLLPPAGLTALPWLNRLNPVNRDVVGAGMLFGVSLMVRRTDCYKAMAAALVFEMARVFEGIRGKQTADCLVVGGGASKGRFFLELLSALFHPLPVFTYREQDLSGARGVLFALNRTVARARTVRVAAPGPAVRARVEARYREYETVFERVYGGDPAGAGLRMGQSA